MLDMPAQPTPAAKPWVNADLLGRTAIVTGSTSGIGLGIARAFAAAGMNVLLNGFGDRAEIDRTVAELAAEHGVKTAYSAADMSRPDDIARMVDETTETFGAVDVLVNNAGIQHVEAVETFPIDKWNAIIAINLSAAFHAIRAAVAGMKARRFGRIINVASAHALVASPFKSAYVVRQTRHRRTDEDGGAGDGRAWHHGECDLSRLRADPLVEKQIPETAKARGLTEEQVDPRRAPARAADPPVRDDRGDRCSGGVPLLDRAARSITGAAMPVEGGWTAQ